MSLEIDRPSSRLTSAPPVAPVERETTSQEIDFSLFRDCWYLTGATASGKSAVAIELARRLRAEIVSLDSMAVYRGLDIGTAKPTPGEQQQIPHHLIDLVEPHDDFSVAEYVHRAAEVVRAIRARRRVPLFVGGTPLYLKSLLRGIFTGPAADWELRRRLLDELQASGPAALHARLAEVDPTAAARLHPNDARRIVRALEVFAATGQPISRLQALANASQPTTPSHVFVLDWPRAELYARINARVEQMFAAGLVAEVVQLQVAGQGLSRTAAQAVGYREVLEYLAHQRDLSATIELVKTRTRQFAKRQLTWFRSLRECRNVGVSQDFDPAEVAARVIGMAEA